MKIQTWDDILKHNYVCTSDVAKNGDYVLGTKYVDGDPNDPWAVGFIYGVGLGAEPVILDCNGVQISTSRIRRWEPITKEIGTAILSSSAVGHSLWCFVEELRSGNTSECLEVMRESL